METASNPPKIGFAFSGGGMKIGWHWGVYRALLEENIWPNVAVGTSAGALINLAVSYIGVDAAKKLLLGLTKKEDVFVMSTWEKLRLLLARVGVGNKNGFYNLDPLKELIYNVYQKNSRPAWDTYACCVNLNTAETSYISNKDPDYPTFVLASSAVPGVMETPTILGHIWGDGGGTEQFPIQWLKNQGCNLIYACGTSPIRKVKHESWNQKGAQIEDFALRVIDIQTHESYYNDVEDCLADPKIVIIVPDAPLPSGSHEVNSEKMALLMDMGYQKAKDILDSYSQSR